MTTIGSAPASAATRAWYEFNSSEFFIAPTSLLPFKDINVKRSVRLDCPVKYTLKLLLNGTWELTQRDMHSAACSAVVVAPRDKTDKEVLAWVDLAFEHGMTNESDIWQALMHPELCLDQRR